MADVERKWFRQRFADQDVPNRYQSEAAPDGDFDGAVPDQAVVDEAWAAWRDEFAFAEQFARDTDLSFVGRDSGANRSLCESSWSMIEEYARHNGHADLLRSASTDASAIGSASGTYIDAAIRAGDLRMPRLAPRRKEQVIPGQSRSGPRDIEHKDYEAGRQYRPGDKRLVIRRCPVVVGWYEPRASKGMSRAKVTSLPAGLTRRALATARNPATEDPRRCPAGLACRRGAR